MQRKYNPVIPTTEYQAIREVKTTSLFYCDYIFITLFGQLNPTILIT